MKKLIPLIAFLPLLCSCQSLYYGYLPGTDYQMPKPQNKIDLHGKSFALEFKDGRGGLDKIGCSPHLLDRETELEGELGYQYFRSSLTAMIEGSNGKVDAKSPNKVAVQLDGLSFQLIGAGYIVAHGQVQFSVSSPSLSRTFCSDMTDRDPDAPLKWYSVVTRKTASRLIVSGSLRRAAESFVAELATAAPGQ
jgi:hypothetical protein